MNEWGWLPTALALSYVLFHKILKYQVLILINTGFIPLFSFNRIPYFNNVASPMIMGRLKTVSAMLETTTSVYPFSGQFLGVAIEILLAPTICILY